MEASLPVQHMQEETLVLIEHMEGLGVEIEAAMAAIAGNRLAAFEQSVSRQEFLCGRLREMAKQVSPDNGMDTPRSSVPSKGEGVGSRTVSDLELAARLHTTRATLQTLNRQYSALLRHSGRSVQMMAALTNNYTQRQEQAGSRVKHQTWSCEG